MKREHFLAEVAKAAKQGAKYRVGPDPVLGEKPGYTPPISDRSARLVAEINQLGGHAELCASTNAVRNRLVELLMPLASWPVLCWQHPVLVQLGLPAIAAGLGVELIDHSDFASRDAASARELAFSAGAGITSATFAIAETGTLVMSAGPGTERAASLLPPVHIAVITPDQILDDLYDLFDHLGMAAKEASPEGLLRPRALPASVVLISGPSKTGDIGLRLTTGVHGPGKLHVLVWQSGKSTD